MVVIFGVFIKVVDFSSFSYFIDKIGRVWISIIVIIGTTKNIIVIIVVLNAIFLMLAVAVMRDTSEAIAKRMFGFSIFYLFALVAVLIADNSIAGML